MKDIIHKDRQRRLENNLWMFEAEYKANEKLKALKSYDEEYLKLPLAQEKHFEKPIKEYAEIDAKNSLFFPPDYSNTNDRSKRSELKMNPAIRGENSIEKDVREGFENPYTQDDKKILDKHIVKENTRLPFQFVENLVQEHTNRIRKRIFEAYENSDVVKLLKELKEIDEQTGQYGEGTNVMYPPTPNINGYKLIKEPKPIPGEIDKNPLFTWGEVASTPTIIKEARFSVPQTPLREDLAHSLATKKTKHSQV